MIRALCRSSSLLKPLRTFGSFHQPIRRMSASGTKVWEQWPKELPTCKETRQYNEYKALTDPAMVKEVSSDIRSKAIERVSAALNGDVDGVAVVMMGGKGSGFEFYCGDTEVSHEDVKLAHAHVMSVAHISDIVSRLMEPMFLFFLSLISSTGH